MRTLPGLVKDIFLNSMTRTFTCSIAMNRTKTLYFGVEIVAYEVGSHKKVLTVRCPKQVRINGKDEGGQR